MNTKEKIEVMQAYLEGEVVQLRYGQEWVDWNSEELGEPVWCWDSDEWRIKPKEVIKPSIEWDHVAKHFNFLATDQTEVSLLYECKPVWSPTLKCWIASKGEYIPARYFQSFKSGTNCPPKDSLVERPNKGE